MPNLSPEVPNLSPKEGLTSLYNFSISLKKPHHKLMLTIYSHNDISQKEREKKGNYLRCIRKFFIKELPIPLILHIVMPPKKVFLKNYIPQENFFSSKGAHSITF